MLKHCKGCEDSKPQDQFSKGSKTCKLCIVLRMNKITHATYNRLLHLQGGKCAMFSAKCKWLLSIDHKEDTIRGLLCTYHNYLVGQYEKLRDEKIILEEYILGALTEFVRVEFPYRVCNIKDCKERVFGRRVCSKHYAQFFSKTVLSEKKARAEERNKLEQDIIRCFGSPDELGL